MSLHLPIATLQPGGSAGGIEEAASLLFIGISISNMSFKGVGSILAKWFSMGMLMERGGEGISTLIMSNMCSLASLMSTLIVSTSVSDWLWAGKF